MSDKPDEPFKLFKCSYEGCSSSFTRIFRLNSHIRKHKGERPFICTFEGCEKAFTCKSYLNKHLKRPHDDKVASKKKKYICDCGKEFKTKFLLKTHSAEHTGDKIFKCDTCDAAFALRYRLIRHKKRHLGYQCKSCEYKAETWTQLRKHIATEHKPINKCTICGRTYSTAFNLKVHMGAHKFACSYDGCEKTFARAKHLKDHEQEHINYIKCPVEACKEKFTNEIVLYAHSLSHQEKSYDNTYTKRQEKIIYSCRKSMAQKLSGYIPNSEQLNSIFRVDKDFRRQILGN